MKHIYTRGLLGYQIIYNHFYRIDSSFVDDLRNFDISCVLSGNFLSCTTDSTTLPGRTMCQVDSQAPSHCKKCELLPLTCTNNTSCVRNNAMQVHMFYTLTKRACILKLYILSRRIYTCVPPNTVFRLWINVLTLHHSGEPFSGQFDLSTVNTPTESVTVTAINCDGQTAVVSKKPHCTYCVPHWTPCPLPFPKTTAVTIILCEIIFRHFFHLSGTDHRCLKTQDL